MPGEIRADKVKEGTAEPAPRKKSWAEALDEMLEAEAPKSPAALASTEPAPPEDEPGLPKQGFGGSRFWVELDALLRAEGIPDDALPEAKPLEFETHEWEDDGEGRHGPAVFSDDQIRWRCKKCFRLLDMTREETIGGAIDRHKISRVCGEQLAQDLLNPDD
jgi:hypothetical protein